ncbi:uncharacterized protein LOC142985822 [Anticarsia gemmatalis]|uniref:uncharacterized protein LOC142985822 n=1 Tax=Anticarsia gemmatalis TaxID=129554 RepID=UPI003F764127
MQSTPPSGSLSSPNLLSLSDTGDNVTQRKRKQPECELTNAIDTLNQVMNKKLDELQRYFECAISKLSDSLTTIATDLATVTQTTCDIKNELSSLKLEHNKLENKVSLLDKKQGTMLQDITELKKSVQYTSEQQEDLNKRVKNINQQTESKGISNDNTLRLEAKIDALEQQARQCNIEVCNVPEKRNENLLTLMETISAKINCPLQQKDIIAIHRVPHAQNTNKKPKNIVVKFSSRILRDNILSAARLAKGLKSDQIGISSIPQSIYLNEHLTLKNKQLFRTARETARQKGFKYVWVKHATILVRENDSAPAMAIRTPQDLARIKPNGSSTKRS